MKVSMRRLAILLVLTLTLGMTGAVGAAAMAQEWTGADAQQAMAQWDAPGKMAKYGSQSRLYKRPRSISLAKTAKVLGLARGANTKNDVTPVVLTCKPNRGASFSYDVVSENPDIVSVEKTPEGRFYLKAHRAGSTYIRAGVANEEMQVVGPFAKLKVTVKEEIRLTKLTRQVNSLLIPGGDVLYDLADVVTGKPLMADAVAPDGSVRLSWTSKNPEVAATDADGNVWAVGAGKTTLTGRATDGSHCKVTLKVSVKAQAPGPKKVNCRVYVIANSDYPGTNIDLDGPITDKKILSGAYKNASFAGVPAEVFVHENLGSKQVMKVLCDMAKSGADEDDLSVFYYSGHGEGGSDPALRGALYCVDDANVPVDRVRAALDRVPGRVLVILDSCLSGQFIEQKSVREQAEAAKDYNQAVIAAFAGATAKKPLPDSSVSKKYMILTASRPLELAWETDKHGLFTYYLGKGIGFDDEANPKVSVLHADTNGDMRVSLSEIYDYAAPKVYEGSISDTDSITQHVMVWPANDQSAVIARD
ncbi:MAG: caspase family protein [Clostridia bacterium]